MPPTVGPLTTGLAILGIALAGVGASFARSPLEPPDALEGLRAQIDEARYVEAEAGARRLLAGVVARSAPDSLAVADVLDALVDARRLGGWGRSPETRRLAERSLAIRERSLAPDDPGVAVGLSGLGRVFYSSGAYDESGRCIERALAIRRARLPADDPLVATSLTELGTLELARGNFDRAEQLEREALAIRERVLGPDDPAVAKTLSLLAASLLSRAQYDEARRLFERAAAIMDRARPEHPDAAYVLAGLGNLLMAIGAYEEAKPVFERALAIREKRLDPNHPDLAMSHNNLGVLAKRMEHYEEAQRHFEQALPVIEGRLGSKHPLTAMILNNLAGVLWQMGAPEEALPYSRRALSIREETLSPDHPDLAQSYQSLAILLEDLGTRAESEAFYRRALDTYERALGPEHPQIAVTLWRLAGLLRDSGRPEEALALSARALAIGESGPHAAYPDHASSLAVHGSLLHELGRCEEAVPLLERARDIWTRTGGPTHPEVGRIEAGLARLYLRTDRRGEAMTTALNAEDVWREHLRLSARTLPERQALQAERVRTPSIDVLLELAGSASPPEADFVDRAWDAVVRSRAVVLDQMAARHRALASDEDPVAREAARRYAETSKALADLLVQEDQGIPPERARAVLDSVRAERDRAEIALLPRSSELQHEIERARVGWREVAAALPDSSALVAYARFDAEPPGPCARGPVRAIPRYLAFVLPSAGAHPIVVSLGDADAIDSLVAGWRQEVGHDPGGGDVGAREEACRQAGRALAARVWDPVAARLDRATHAWIVPDGELHLVNFAALPAEGSGFLVDRGPVLHLLNAERDLVPMPVPPASPAIENGDGLLVLGDPDFDAAPPAGAPSNGTEEASREARLAPYRGERAPCVEFARMRWSRLKETAGEVAETAALWAQGPGSKRDARGRVPPAAALSLTGRRATEAAFKKNAPGRDVLHLATHGFFLGDACTPATGGERGMGGYVEVEPSGNAATPSSPGAIPEDMNPLRLSGLVLAGANRRESAGPAEEDGILTSEEIASLDLSRVSWAVLSACNTGLGELRTGEGVLGLRRAFQVAGVNAVIMSLWPVGDVAARAYMRELYRARFVERRGTAEAATRASRELLRERRLRGASTHPFYWAPFVVVETSR